MESNYGWSDIVDRMMAALKEVDPDVRIAHKEKFGMLRVSVRTPNDQNYANLNAIARAAEIESVSVCEACGRPGVLREQGPWIKTLCDEHAEAYYEHGWRWWDTGFEEDGITAKLPVDQSAESQ